ncbi:hypothetical protein [Mechercharimyces sp. CAU 1602]|uniref:hypothetical protein n=1 Tax=Mechercharimyces sp. CAU 1602 TaxID=2973933 RepID=UPI002161EC5D|nr:hypothetical protein [Mechercharimyces sp. CAU 1602]MCS1351719.1 hypothetical protein [Mechercharimyces sp. CAU 1602]
MDKKIYYVAFHSGESPAEIRETKDENDAFYDFEIEATTDERNELEILFERTAKEDFDGLIKTHVPFLVADSASQEDKEYDYALQDLYQKIYDLGTTTTKKKLKELGIPKQ